MARKPTSWICACLLTWAWLLGTIPAFAQTGRDDSDFTQRAAIFAYDANADFTLKVAGTEKRGPVSILDITFVAAPGQAPVKAYLVQPEGKGPFAATLWVHWLGERASNREEFLEEAIAMAPKGMISLLIDAMWSDPKWYEGRDPDSDYAHSITQVIAIRRSMDLLLSQPGVDRARVGYVGHDFGGMYGAIAAGLDSKARTYVFVAVTSSLSNWAFFASQPRSKVAYLRQNAVLELTDYLAQIKGASVLCQFGKNDAFISTYDGYVFWSATPKPHDRKVYEAKHDMQAPQVMADRDQWLSRELGLRQ